MPTRSLSLAACLSGCLTATADTLVKTEATKDGGCETTTGLTGEFPNADLGLGMNAYQSALIGKEVTADKIEGSGTATVSAWDTPPAWGRKTPDSLDGTAMCCSGCNPAGKKAEVKKDDTVLYTPDTPEGDTEYYARVLSVDKKKKEYNVKPVMSVQNHKTEWSVQSYTTWKMVKVERCLCTACAKTAGSGVWATCSNGGGDLLKCKDKDKSGAWSCNPKPEMNVVVCPV